MSLQLTAEQKEKLCKLDEEMKRRKEYSEKSRSRREASSKATGIPMNIVEMDVIRIGILLGLIKKKSILEGKEPNTTGSLISMFLGDEDKFNIDRSKIPNNFRNAPTVFSEEEKINYHQEYVKHQCEQMSNMITGMINEEINNIKSHIAINLETHTIDTFKTVCVETIEVILEELCEDGEDDDSLWSTLTVTRNALLGVVDICEYKKILNDQIMMLRKSNKVHSRIMDHLSVNDVRLSLYKGCLKQTQCISTNEDLNRLSREVILRCYMKPPELRPFDFKDILRHCCIPSLVCLPVDKVIEHGLLGPYRNNSIGYLDMGKKQANTWSFYNLKSINEDGVRLWVLDNKLWMLTDNMISAMSAYMIKIFRTFYREFYDTNEFRHGFWMASQNKHYDAFTNMMNNISFISNHVMFHKFLMMIMTQRSCLIPTEYDFFNHLTHYDFSITYAPYVKCFDENMKHIFDKLSAEHLDKLKSLFIIAQIS
jgi:hypothetical protein